MAASPLVCTRICQPFWYARLMAAIACSSRRAGYPAKVAGWPSGGVR